MEIWDCDGGERLSDGERRKTYVHFPYVQISYVYIYMIYMWKENLGENRCLMERDEETCISKTQLHMVIGML